jgi:ketosteroid isomerase-like protein
MSEENVEIVRRGYRAFDSGDLSGALDAFHPEAVIRRVEPEIRTWQGPDGFLQALADWTEGFDEFQASAEEFIDADSRVVVRIHQRVRGTRSGATVEADFWFVHTITDRMVTRLDMFADRTQALEAAGLSE